MKILVPDRFNVIRILREDASSKTFLASDSILKQTDVLVKMIRKDDVNRDRDSLLQQLSWYSGIRHQNLGTIFDVGLTPKGDLYYVRQYLPASEFSSANNLTAIRTLITAIGFLQSNGQVHGAIKPSNIFMSDGLVKLTDPYFRTPESNWTEESIRYSAPEVLRGEIPDLQSDLYSIGAILYRGLTQRNPFEDTNLGHLRSKYVWASPAPIGNVSDVPKAITDLVMLLLEKDPNKRTIAFKSLSEQVGIVPKPCLQPPFIGREAILKETIDLIGQFSTGGLQVLLLEGMPGVGKSRFVEELRLRCAVLRLAFLKCDCLTPGASQTVCGAIRELLGAVLPCVGKPKRVSAASESNHVTNQTERIENEKATEELVESLAVSARQRRLAVAIDNIEHADRTTLQLLELLSSRASELPFTLILTRRSLQSEMKLTPTLNAYLPDRLRRIRIRPLPPTESSQLMRYVNPAYNPVSKLSSDVQQSLGGNPLLIEDHATSESAHSNHLSEALNWIMSEIPKESRRLTRTLSTLKKPIDLETLAKITAQDISNLKEQLVAFEELGIIERCENGFKIAHSRLAALIHGNIPRSVKLDIAKRTFEALQTTGQQIDLAYYAFEAGMFKEAANLNKQSANSAFKKQNYASALIQYEQLRQCLQRCHAELTPVEKLNLARCYQWAGRQRQARVLYEDLLSSSTVQSDPELLSHLYSSIANRHDRIPAPERIRLMQLSIECLPADSMQRGKRYLVLCEMLLKMGDIVAAREALACAQRSHILDSDKYYLEFDQRSVFLTQGDFQKAADVALLHECPVNAQAVRFNNLAVCFEHLGNLSKAYQLQLRAYELTHNGLIHSLTLSNLGSIKTKCGEIHAAAKLFEDALSSIEALQKREATFYVGKFATVYSDAALYNIHLGKYQQAAECLGRIRPSVGLTFEIDRSYSETVRCLFYREIGFTRKTRSLLEQLKHSQTFNVPFFKVEQAILEARMPDVSSGEKQNNLQKALEITHQLGTLYQQCQVMNELASVLISANEGQKALNLTKPALQLAQKHGYRLLRTRALLLSGIASEKHQGKKQKLLAAFQNASEMGLQELVAESAFYLGTLHLESGNLVTAREYLSRSVSTTENLANEMPTQFRATYKSMPWRRDAWKELERCNVALQRQPVCGASISLQAPGTDRYFKAAYNFALSGGATKSAEGLVNQIEQTLQTSLGRGAIIVLKDLNGPLIRGVSIKLADELLQRVRYTALMAKNRIYFGAPDISRPKEIVAWVPLQSDTWEGGIYVVCRQNEPPLSEKDMELLAIIGTIGNGALKSLESNQAAKLENVQLTEFHGMVGASKAIREVYSHLENAAKNTATVIIEGESGTGKELVAKAIHAAGPRAKQPFIPVDCGAIPEALIEAELFGAKKGSYTGALTDRAGLFEAANRGTIFLDEISNTSLTLQAKLLRVIQEREIRRIGETKDRPIDVRLIVASNRKLEELVAEGRFRKDLLYRLKVLHIKVPPLRNRREDIPMIAHAFLQKLNASNKLKKYCAPGVIDQLAAQNFPGNVRELQNAVERAYFLAKTNVIHDVPVEDSIAPNKDEVQSWFKDLSEGRMDFWQTVHDRFKRRDITRDKVVALVDLGLRSSGGSYAALASKFHLKRNEYRRFMDFLRRSDCLLDFRPYRQAAAHEADSR